MYGCKTVRCLQEQVNELRHMILMMTGQGEREESRGGENKETRGNVREKAGRRRKMEKGRVCNKRKITG